MERAIRASLLNRQRLMHSNRTRYFIRILILVQSDSWWLSILHSLTTPRRYGYHVPAVRKRDTFYSKLEEQRAKNAQA